MTNLEDLLAVETALKQAAMLDNPNATALERDQALAVVASTAGEVRRVAGELEAAGIDGVAFALHVHGHRSLDDVADALGYAQGKASRATNPIKRRLVREHDRRAANLTNTLTKIPAEQVTAPAAASDTTAAAVAELHHELAAARAGTGTTDRVRAALDALLATAGTPGSRPAGELLVHLDRLVTTYQHQHDKP
ncbi:hypothetical protein ACVDFE_00320 [Lentzea chajnantorensis]